MSNSDRRPGNPTFQDGADLPKDMIFSYDPFAQRADQFRRKSQRHGFVVHPNARAPDAFHIDLLAACDAGADCIDVSPRCQPLAVQDRRLGGCNRADDIRSGYSLAGVRIGFRSERLPACRSAKCLAFPASRPQTRISRIGRTKAIASTCLCACWPYPSGVRVQTSGRESSRVATALAAAVRHPVASPPSTNATGRPCCLGNSRMPPRCERRPRSKLSRIDGQDLGSKGEPIGHVGIHRSTDSGRPSPQVGGCSASLGLRCRWMSSSARLERLPGAAPDRPRLEWLLN